MDAKLNDEEGVDKNVQIWKVKRLIRSLEKARGNGTSMISLVIPPKDQISRLIKLLGDELGTATNIKSRVNRLSVLGAINSVIQRLKLYQKIPPNGLVIFCGTVLSQEGKEKKVNIDFEPFKPINTSLYLCDNKFHTECLTALLDDDTKFGFIIIDGSGSLFGVVSGNTKEVLYKFSVELPKKHGRGGQSALRFARLRMERRHNYLRKVAESAVQCFITNDKLNVNGLILAGSADFKSELAQSDLMDNRIQSRILKIVDISYGGESGFNQAIDLAKDVMIGVKFIHEKQVITKYFEEIALDTGKYSYGIVDTMTCLELGAVEQLIIWENIDCNRYILKNPLTGEENVLLLNSKQETDRKFFVDSTSNTDLDILDKTQLVEWVADNYKSFGASLEIISDKSSEGAQFCKGFGGMGSLLRYKLDIATNDYSEDENDEFEESEGLY